MSLPLFPLLLFNYLFCAFTRVDLPLTATTRAERPVVDRPDFKSFFDDQQVTGSFLVYDQKNSQYTAYQYKRCQQGFLPASTFKVINTLIGLETGAVNDENTVIKWDGIKRDIAAWNQDQTLESAFRVSCVPYYQEVARRVGLERMQTLVKKAQYGHMDIQAGNLDRFWLEGNSRISQVEEVDFLRRVYTGQVPFTKRNLAILKKIMLLDEQPTYKLYAKTGLAANLTDPDLADSKLKTNIGWFVGYVETSDNVYFFATNIEHPSPLPDTFVPGRRKLTEVLLRELKIIP